MEVTRSNWILNIMDNATGRFNSIIGHYFNSITLQKKVDLMCFISCKFWLKSIYTTNNVRHISHR
jgi:hypothetical protein